jgi:hypothetical protein
MTADDLQRVAALIGPTHAVAIQLYREPRLEPLKHIGMPLVKHVSSA